MRLYTIQKVTAWEQFQKSGILSPEEPQVEQDFLPAYKWMLGQMAKRIPNFSGRYPVWAWVDRPDLRTINWSGGPHILLTLDIPDERVLVSDFSAWHMVLNGCLIVLDEMENTDALSDEEYDRQWKEWNKKMDAATQAEKEASWEMIFSQYSSDIWSGLLQACIDQVFLHEVVESRLLKQKNWTYKCDR